MNFSVRVALTMCILLDLSTFLHLRWMVYKSLEQIFALFLVD